MKKRIALLILAVVCLIGVCVIAASADGEPATAIPGHNLALEDCVNIIYYANFENVPAEAETGVLVWTSAQDSYTYGKEEAKLSANGTYLTYDKFFFGVPAKMMNQDIYAVSYIKDGEEITYSALDKYSVLQYAYNKKGSSTTFTGGTITLGEFLLDMLNYGTSAQKLYGYNTDRLANATYYQITVEGGTLPDGTTKGLYKAGESVTLNATVENFDHWENAAEETVESTITVTGTETYTAIAGSEQAEPSTDPIEIEEQPVYSEGLHIRSYGDGTCYIEDTGLCSDVHIVIPPTSPDGDTVIAIQDHAFAGNCYIQSVTIPANVTIIESNAFSDCRNLKQVIFAGDSQLTTIMSGAFDNCFSLTSITIPASVTEIQSSALMNCNSLANITVEEGNTHYHSVDNCLVETASKILVAGCKNSIIPSDGSVTTIAHRAFSGHSTLISIEIPTSVTIISNYAFYGCSGLTSIEIPASVTEISDYAFARCTSLTSIEVPNVVRIIGEGVFSECANLTSISIPSSVERIGNLAFEDCAVLTSINYDGTKKQWDSIDKYYWAYPSGSFIVHCTDGDIVKE